MRNYPKDEHYISITRDELEFIKKCTTSTSLEKIKYNLRFSGRTYTEIYLIKSYVNLYLKHFPDQKNYFYSNWETLERFGEDEINYYVGLEKLEDEEDMDEHFNSSPESVKELESYQKYTLNRLVRLSLIYSNKYPFLTKLATLIWMEDSYHLKIIQDFLLSEHRDIYEKYFYDLESEKHGEATLLNLELAEKLEKIMNEEIVPILEKELDLWKKQISNSSLRESKLLDHYNISSDNYYNLEYLMDLLDTGWRQED